MVFFCIGIFHITSAQAGTVRKTYSDGVTMLPVNLRMGQSTILRFVEKPKKVVLGNSNYYSIEFIENDLAIQPLGAVTTNLFVYGIKNVYGFILRTNKTANYDDLVQVDLKENKLDLPAKPLLKASPLKEISRPKLKISLGRNLKATLLRIQRFEGKDFYMLDILFENTSEVEIDLSKIEISLSRGKLKLSPQEFVLKEPKLKSGATTSARILVSVDRRSDLSLRVQFKNLKAQQIISRWFL